MKKSYILPTLALASFAFFAFQRMDSNGVIVEFKKQHLLQTGGGQSGLTGAPGEANCTQCHNDGSTQDGSTQNTLTVLEGTSPVTSYTPGNSYTVGLAIASNANGKAGFSAVALDGTNTNAGSFTGDAGIGGTQDFTASGRHYVSHMASSTNPALGWGWTWTAPATDVGDVTFYVATNETNNSSSQFGDVIYLSQHVISAAGGSAGLEENTNETGFTAGYSASANKLTLDFNYLSTGEMFLNLVDMNGRSIYTNRMGASEIGENHESIVLPASLKNGIYVVHFFVGNKAMSSKILVQR